VPRSVESPVTLEDSPAGAPALSRGRLILIPNDLAPDPSDPPIPQEIMLSSKGITKIGRGEKGSGENVDVRIDAKDMPNFISRVHAIVECHADGVVSVKDMGSKNGTFHNTIRVQSVDRLNHGDVLCFGARGDVCVGQPHPSASRFQYRLDLR
jgi:hypothetical protein